MSDTVLQLQYRGRAKTGAGKEKKQKEGRESKVRPCQPHLSTTLFTVLERKKGEREALGDGAREHRRVKHKHAQKTATKRQKRSG